MTLLLEISPELHGYLEMLRTAHFPKHKLKDTAHITLLYHIHLPKEKIIEKLEQLDIHKFDIKADKVIAFDRGNAIGISGEHLSGLHHDLKKLFKGKLTRRDLVKFKPHATIQLNVSAFKAQNTLKTLQENFAPKAGQAIGLSLWDKDRKKRVQVWSLNFQ